MFPFKVSTKRKKYERKNQQLHDNKTILFLLLLCLTNNQMSPSKPVDTHQK